MTEPLPVKRVGELESEPAERHWLIRDLWGRAAIGLIGGAPKCCKSWLGLDMATSVASNTPALGVFPVEDPGPALVYLAEDGLGAVRARIQALCDHRGLDLARLDLHVIAVPALRLDLERDQQRLAATLRQIRPRLLLLDPLVRLHRLDENSASEISGLLGYIRELQRTFDTAVALVHHASKKQRAQPGQALRGSSDLHAIGDSNAYLARRQDGQLVLTLEHRAAKPPDPMRLELVSTASGTATHLEVRDRPREAPPPGGDPMLPERILRVLRLAGGLRNRQQLRDELRVNNERLGHALAGLEKDGHVERTPHGWRVTRPADQGQLDLS